MLTHFGCCVHVPWRSLCIGGRIRVWKDIQFDLFVPTALLVTRDVFSALRGSCCDGIVAKYSAQDFEIINNSSTRDQRDNYFNSSWQQLQRKLVMLD